jgi:hypothetical protein
LAPHFQEPQLLVRLAVALAIGLLIGIEESDSRCQSAEEECAIGIRNLGVVGLLAGLTVQFGNSSLAVLVAVWTVLITTLRYWRESGHQSGSSPLNLTVTILTFFLAATVFGNGVCEGIKG